MPMAERPRSERPVFDLREVAGEDVWRSWMRESDPANLQPKVRPLNQRLMRPSRLRAFRLGRAVAHFVNDHTAIVAKGKTGKCSLGSFADGRELNEPTRKPRR